ncbi:hypothetical protein DFH08DRAFT_821207 [Mycena albidolilacea]|uniref:Uncharacterized protein n=1 Tax=Mycena albidolilacea TaxID=1033008 RepID=A0AAD6ZBI5_9AGAR|nr:hypothetical protein DFH08DRAFT_821207 [Mycena albidolilacea]
MSTRGVGQIQLFQSIKAAAEDFQPIECDHAWKSEMWGKGDGVPEEGGTGAHRVSSVVFASKYGSLHRKHQRDSVIRRAHPGSEAFPTREQESAWAEVKLAWVLLVLRIQQSCDMMLRIMVREFQGMDNEIYLTFRCEVVAGDKGSVTYVISRTSSMDKVKSEANPTFSSHKSAVCCKAAHHFHLKKFKYRFHYGIKKWTGFEPSHIGIAAELSGTSAEADGKAIVFADELTPSAPFRTIYRSLFDNKHNPNSTSARSHQGPIGRAFREYIPARGVTYYVDIPRRHLCAEGELVLSSAHICLFMLLVGIGISARMRGKGKCSGIGTYTMTLSTSMGITVVMPVSDDTPWKVGDLRMKPIIGGNLTMGYK